MKKLFLLYLAIIVHVSLYPWLFVVSGFRVGDLLLLWEPVTGRSAYLDLVLNFLLYIPLGVLGALAWRSPRQSRWSLIWVVAVGTVLTFSLETLQAWVPGRDSSMRDVVLNIIGTIVGVCAAKPVAAHWQALGVDRATLVRRPMPWVFLCAWVVAQCFPFIPILRLGPFANSLHRLLGPAAPLEVARTFLGALLICYLLRRSLTARAHTLCTLLALGVIPLRVMLQSGGVSWQEGVAAAAAWAVSGWLARFRTEATVLACLSFLLIAVAELSPFAFTSPPAQFQWIPFAGSLESGRAEAVRVLAAKFFLYGSAVWVGRDARLPLWGSAGLVTTLLLLGESAQRYLPGRVPELTDPLLALLAALIVFYEHDRSNRAAPCD